jgi:hypothetical protein
LAGAALTLSIFACPFLSFVWHTIPFWTGHALERVGKVLDSIPWQPAFAILSLPLAIAALVRKPPTPAVRNREEVSMAAAAIVLSLLWLALSVAVWFVDPLSGLKGD